MVSKKILITAGTVYGPLDDNKLVGNRVRGIWATRFARWLLHRGHHVTLLVADIQRSQINDYWEQSFGGNLPRRESTLGEAHGSIDIRTHRGFWDYQELCHGNQPGLTTLLHRQYQFYLLSHCMLELS